MTIGRSYCIVIQVLRKHDAAVAQSVERRIGSAEVTGPIPVSSFVKALYLQGFFFFMLHFVLHDFIEVSIHYIINFYSFF